MPALVVWEERLLTGGDDLRLVSAFAFILRMVQISIFIYIIVHVMRFDHNPAIFVLAGCLRSEEAYWTWYKTAIVGCFLTLTYGVIGALIQIAMFQISGRGTPTEAHVRRYLVPLCKCNMVPMLIVRTSGFIFAVVALTLTESYCTCARNNLAEKIWHVSACPTDARTWYVAARILIFTMACDAAFPAITLIVVLRRRIQRLYRHVRPRERDLEDVERSWQMTCKRCCECWSLMTCCMFGGQKLTAGSYADVAIALTDFLDGEGSLDIVPSDVAAALICLVNIQKKKQIACKNELLNEGGIFAKDRTLATRLWRQFIESNTTTNPWNLIRKPEMCKISGSLRRSISMSKDSIKNIEDIETGFPVNENDHYPPAEVTFHSLGEEKEEVEDEGEAEGRSLSMKQPPAVFSIQPTDTQLEHLRQMILTGSDTMQQLGYRLIHKNGTMAFEPSISRILSPQNSFDCLMLGEGSRYCAAALASYSWMMFLWTNKCTGCCQLTMNSAPGVCTCNRKCFCNNEKIVGGDFCGWKQASVLKSLGIDESDVVCANFSNDVGVNPYLILRDRKWKTVVLVIRGTFSFEDVISDVTISPESLEKVGEQSGFNGSGEYCHSGILTGAKWIYDDLKQHSNLEKVMEAHPDFGLRIVGHSLGAGVAAMLGRMLRQQFPNLYCLCFSPPGCVFSERTAQESKDYVCSFVLHNDIVPRLSYDSLVNLRNDLVEIIARIKVPKHEVFDSNWTFRNENITEETVALLLHSREEIPASHFFTQFQQFVARQAQRQEKRNRSHIKMTVPGRILHMVRTSARLDNIPCGCLLSCAKIMTCWEETKKYKIRWTNAEDLSEIYISPTMMMDHFPYNVAHALNVAAESYGVVDQATGMHERDQLERILEGAKKDS